MERSERLAVVRMALGKVSVDFMRQSADVVMPTAALLEVASMIEEMWNGEVVESKAEIARLRKALAFCLDRGARQVYGRAVVFWDLEPVQIADSDSAVATVCRLAGGE